MDTRKFIKNLLFVTIALAGLIAAGLILFSPGGDVVSNGIITALLILLTDGFILVGLVSRYEWLKVTTWIASLYALIVAVVLTWMPNKYDVERYSSGNYGCSGYDYTSTPNNAVDILENLTAGAYIILVALSFACVFSLVSKTRSVLEKEKVPYYGYVGALALAIFSGVVLGMAASWDTEGIVLRLGFSLMFLSFTCTFIMIVAIIISSTKTNREKASQMVNQQPPYNPYAQHVQQQQHMMGGNGEVNQGQRGAYNSQTLRNEPQNQSHSHNQNYNNQQSVQQPVQNNQQQSNVGYNPNSDAQMNSQKGYDYQESPTMGQSNQNVQNQPNNGINKNDSVVGQETNNNPSVSVPPRPEYTPTNQYPPKPEHAPTNHLPNNNSTIIPPKPTEAPNTDNPNSDGEEDDGLRTI